MARARLLCAGVAVVVAMGIAAAPALADNETVTFTSAGETAVVVPPGVTSVDVTAVGGSGGAGDAGEGSLAGGQGAQVSGTIAVTPGQTIYLEVGGDGASADSASDHGDNSGGGGGASDVRTAPASAGLSPDTRLLVAGGGGGTGWGSSPGVLPGAGGDAGQAGGSGSCVTGGGAGTQAGGGAAGTVNSSSSSLASPGSLGNGGQGADYITFRYNPYEPEYPHGWYESAGGFNGGGSGGGFITNYYSYYGGGGGGGGYYGGGGGGGNTLNADGSNGCLLGGGGDGGGGGGGSNLVPAGGSATIPAAGTSPSITLSFEASAAPVVGLTALPAVTTAQPDGYQLAVTGACESALGDSPTVSVALYAGSSDSGTPASTGSAQCQSGAWSATVSTSGLANGQYTALATQSNQASMTNDSSPSTFTLDQTVPALSLSTPALSGSTTAWVKSTPTFAGTAGTAARDDSTVSVTFTPVAGGAAVQTLSAAVNSSTGAWSVTASPALADGDYVATVTQQDNLGNISTVTGQLEVKTTVPVLTGFGCLTLGTPGDATPFCDGSADTSNGDLPDVTVSLYAGATASGTPVATLHVSADVDNLGFFQVAFSAPLSDGTYTAQAVQDDKAGNMGNATVTFTIATVKLDPIDGHSSLPTFAGVCAVGAGEFDTSATLKVYAGDTTTGTPVQTIYVACTPGTGTFSAPATSALADGTYTAEAIQSDVVGDTATSTQTFTVSTASAQPSGTGTSGTGTSGTPAVATAGRAAIIRVSSSGQIVRVTVACSGSTGAACRAALALVAVETFKRGRLVAITATSSRHRRSRPTSTRKTILLADAQIKLAAGHQQALQLTPNGVGRVLVDRYHRLAAKLEMTGILHGKTSILASRTITLKPARQKAAHRRRHRHHPADHRP